MTTSEILQGIKNWIVTKLGNGGLIPKLATNLESWDELGDLSVEDTWSGNVRTSGGDLSIISGQGGRLVSIVSAGAFYASALKATGFNLLRNATAIGDGYYFPVPALEFGTYGTAEKPNGILFTDSNHNNLTPTVRFKAMSAGVPTSVSDGSTCAYTDSNGHRFYTTSQAGYMIVSGITLASTCAHVGWSRRYDEYVAVDDANDAGGSVALSTLIDKVHSYDLMLSVSRNGVTVADSIIFGSTAATWYRKVDRVQPTWTTVADEVEEGATQTYTHTATISGMKSDGAVSCGNLSLDVAGTTISYQDTSDTATTDYVIYELSSQVTGTVTISPDYAIEDWGLEMLENATGTAYITTMYAQGYPDTLAAIASIRILAANAAVAQAFAQMKARLDGMEYELKNPGTPDFYTMPTIGGQPQILFGEGAPSVVPMYVGQRYHDTLNKKIYEAMSVTNSTADWVLLN